MPRFSIKKKPNMVLKHFILPVEHFKANFFFLAIPRGARAPKKTNTHPQDCWDGDTKRGDVGLIKVKKQVDFKIHFSWFIAFLDHVFFKSPLNILSHMPYDSPHFGHTYAKIWTYY